MRGFVGIVGGFLRNEKSLLPQGEDSTGDREGLPEPPKEPRPPLGGALRDLSDNSVEVAEEVAE